MQTLRRPSRLTDPAHIARAVQAAAAYTIATRGLDSAAATFLLRVAAISAAEAWDAGHHVRDIHVPARRSTACASFVRATKSGPQPPT